MAVKKEKLWTRDFILSFLTGFSSSMIMSSMLTLMAVYSMGKFGVGEGLAGFSASIMLVGCVVGRLFVGRYTDRIGRRKLAIHTYSLNMVFCALYFLPMGHIGQLYAIRLAHGIVNGGSHNILTTSVIDFIPPARRAEGIGMFTLNYTVAMAIGPALGMAVAARWSYEAFFGVNICFGAAALIFLLCIRFVPTAFTEEQMSQLRSRIRIGDIFERSALPFAFMIILLSMCYTGVTAFIETYTELLGIMHVAAIFFVVYGLVLIVMRPLAGRLVDRRGENFVVIPTILIYAAGLATMGFAGVFPTASAELVIAAAVMMASGFGSVLPMGLATAVKYGEPHRYSRITSTYYVFSDGAMGIGALVFGHIATGTGFSNMFFVAIPFVLTGLAIYWLLHGRHHRSSRGQSSE